jgi:hypothetical protein
MNSEPNPDVTAFGQALEEGLQTGELPQVEPAVEALKLTLNIIRRRRQDHDSSVAFTVKPACKKQFENTLSNMLRMTPGLRHVDVHEVTDSETKKSTKMILDLHGEPQIIEQYLRQNAGNLIPFCESIT